MDRRRKEGDPLYWHPTEREEEAVEGHSLDCGLNMATGDEATILQQYSFEPESGGPKPGCESPSAPAPQLSPAVGAVGAGAASFHTIESTFRGVPGGLPEFLGR
ncbi:unnamed protein product [Pleuronectes platessa]|uniref:Uncharacterized protein n=1 Tax=Pleuronectes platessa TaxID=8262 RepID=A0A9N7TQ47_PLEPL|nr:unnamed protein product [Pleuronectes platessa]